MKTPFFLLLFFVLQLTILNAQQSVSLNFGTNYSLFYSRPVLYDSKITALNPNYGFLASAKFQLTNKKYINWNIALDLQSKNGLGNVEFRHHTSSLIYYFDVKMMFAYVSFYPEFYFEESRSTRISTGPMLGINTYTKGSCTIMNYGFPGIGFDTGEISDVSHYFNSPDFRWFVGFGYDYPLTSFTKISGDIRFSYGFTDISSSGNKFLENLNTIDFGMTLGFKRWF